MAQKDATHISGKGTEVVDMKPEVEARADRILGGKPATEAYAVHFEAQMRGGKMRKLLYVSYLHFARAGAYLARLSYVGFDDPLPPSSIIQLPPAQSGHE
jgi:hypothetical protein